MKVKISQRGIIVISAKDLFEELGKKGHLHDWTKSFDKKGIIENIGYAKVKRINEETKRQYIDYVLRGDFAVMLCRFEESEDGDRCATELESFIALYSKPLITKEEVIKLSDEASMLNGQKLSTKDFTTITLIAKTYGMSAIAMNNILKCLGIIFKSNRTYVTPISLFDKGLVAYKNYEVKDSDCPDEFKIKTDVYWTSKGVYFIEKIMKKLGIEKRGEYIEK